jgi:hypothetical protein
MPWIALPNGELRNLATIAAVVPYPDRVTLEEDVLYTGARRVTTIVHVASLAEARKIVADIADQIDHGVQVLYVLPDTETEEEDTWLVAPAAQAPCGDPDGACAALEAPPLEP